MESEETSLSSDSWVDLGGDDPNLYPDVHSDDDLYSSSMITPKSPSSQERSDFSETQPPPSGQSHAASGVGVQILSNARMSSYSTKSQGQVNQTKASDFVSQKSSVPRASTSESRSTCLQETDFDSMDWTSQESPNSSPEHDASPKRPRTMNDFESERGERSGPSTRGGPGGRRKGSPKKKLEFEERHTYDGRDTKSRGHGGGGNRGNKRGNRGDRLDCRPDNMSREQDIRSRHGNNSCEHSQQDFEKSLVAKGAVSGSEFCGQGNARRPLLQNSYTNQQGQQSQPGPSNINKQADTGRYQNLRSEDEGGEIPSSTVEVSNINPKTSEETVEMYFESKRFGGGPVVSTALKDGTAAITFEDPTGNYNS